MFAVVLTLLACPAEQLGIELPPGGAEGISHEDLRRDTRMLGGSDPAKTFLDRLGQMQLVPDAVPTGLPPGSVCGARGEGAGPGKPRLLVAPWPANPDSATAAAALISIAKAWDLDGGPKGRATLCLLPSGAALDAAVLGTGEGALGVGPLASGEAKLDGRVFAGDVPDPARTAEQINFTELQARVKRVYGML